METSVPSLEVAKQFSDAVKKEFPNQMLAYNCSPNANWKANLDLDTVKHSEKLEKMGFKYQFVTLLDPSTQLWDVPSASNFRDRGMGAYSELQQAEFAAEKDGYTAEGIKEVGTGYFDLISEASAGGESSTTALGSTEADQFDAAE